MTSIDPSRPCPQCGGHRQVKDVHVFEGKLVEGGMIECPTCIGRGRLDTTDNPVAANRGKKMLGDVALPPQSMDILYGHLVIEAVHPDTKQPDYLYWQWLARVLASKGVDPLSTDVVDVLKKNQPYFSFNAYAKIVSKTQYLDVPPKPTFTRKLFPNSVVEEREKKAQVGDDDWEAVKQKLIDAGYVWIVTRRDGEGYWAKPNDAIDSWYYGSGKITLELETLVEELLAELKLHRSTNVKEMLLQLRRRVSVQMELFSRVNRDIIHFQNGMYIISQHRFVRRDMPLPGDLKDLQRRTLRVIPVDFIPDLRIEYPLAYTWDLLNDQTAVACIEWERTLHRLLDSTEHPGQYHRFWQWLGYCLSSITDLNKSAILEGLPDTGKTSTWMTFIKLIEPVDRDLAITAHVDFVEMCDPKDIEFSKYIDGKLIWYDDEMGKEPIKSYTKFKKRVSEETGKVRELYLGSYNSDRVGKFTGCVNILPPVYGISESFGKRVMPFFCQNPYTPEERDEALVHFMRRSVGLARYIVRKAILYLHDLLSNGWKNAMSAEEVVHWWLLKSDIVYNFIKTACDEVNTNRESDDKEDVWAAFTEFREASNIESNSKYAATKEEFTGILGGFGYPVREDRRPKRVKNKDGDMVDKDDVHVKVYFGLKVNHDKIKALLGDETAQRIGEKTKALAPLPKPETETQIMKHIMAALTSTIHAGRYTKSVTVMNTYNANYNTKYTFDEWEASVDKLVAKGKVTRSDDQIIATSFLKTTFTAEKPAAAPAPPRLMMEDDVEISQILSLMTTTGGKIWAEKCAEQLDGMGIGRARQLLKIMELQQLLKNVGDDIYEET